MNRIGARHHRLGRNAAGIDARSAEGVALDEDEKPRLVKSLGDRNVLILRNHGLLVCGATIAKAIRSALRDAWILAFIVEALN